jgi:thioester reductase-like protein
MKTYFITGSTGLVGSYLTYYLLKKNHRVLTIARPSIHESSEKRLLKILNFWQSPNEKIPFENLKVFSGDITTELLGLHSHISFLCKNVDEIFHSAAITDLNYELSLLVNTNVQGTHNTLALASVLKTKGRLKNFHHISTAYVCGKLTEDFGETSTNVDREFNSNYEISKYQAEQLVMKYREKGLNINIYRPPIVAADSLQGKILSLRNIYQIINLCKSNLFSTLPFKNLHIHLVPVDLLCIIIVALSNLDFKNKTYHVFNDIPISVEKLIKLACDLHGFKPPEITSLKDFSFSNLTPTQNKILKGLLGTINWNAKFTCDFTRKTLCSYTNNTLPEINPEILNRILVPTIP